LNIYIQDSKLVEPYIKSKKLNFNYRLIGDTQILTLENIENIYSLIKNQKFEKIEKLFCEFILIIEDENYIFILTDNFGLIKKFYTNQNKHFHFGSFWEVLKSYQKDNDIEIDYTAIYQQFNYGRTFENKTIVKNIFTSNANQLISYDKKKREISLKHYYHYSHSLKNNNLNKKEVIEVFEESLENQRNYIIKNSESTDFIVSLSGGLDSRIIIPYLKNSESKINCFHIGVNNNLLDTYDQYLSKLLLKNEDIEFHLIDPFITKIEEKVNLDILRNPTINSNILKAINIHDHSLFSPNQTYISGGHGGAVGGRLLDNKLIKKIDNQQLKNYLNSKFLLRNEDFFNWDKILPENFDFVESELESLLSNNYDNFGVFMHFHKMRHTNLGVYESLLGQLDFFSIYIPFIWLNSEEWGFSNMKNRQILIDNLKSLEKKYYLTPQQNAKSINNDSAFKLTYQKINKKIRKSSIDYNIWWSDKYFKNYVQDTMRMDSSFYNVFDKSEILKVFSNSNYSQSKENILKLKLIIEYIDQKKFMSESDNFSSSSKY